MKKLYKFSDFILDKQALAFYRRKIPAIRERRRFAQKQKLSHEYHESHE